MEKVRCLFVVAKDQTALWRDLTRGFAGDEGVRVVLDRRQGERRRRPQAYETERRRVDRRQARIDRDLRYHSFVIIHEQQGVRAG